MPEPEDDRGRLARLLRRPSPQQREVAERVREIRQDPGSVASGLVDEALVADEVTSGRLARAYVRFMVDRMDAELDGETRALICELADLIIAERVPDTAPPADIKESSDD